MPVHVPTLVMDDSSESTPSYCEDEMTMAFDLSPPKSSSYTTSNREGAALIRRDREREGRCADCGMQTYEWQWDAHTNQQVKLPLTIPQEVHRGRCLLCHPMSASVQRAQQPEDLAQQPNSPSCRRLFVSSAASTSYRIPVHIRGRDTAGPGGSTARRRISSLGPDASTNHLTPPGHLGFESDPNVRLALQVLERADICDLLSIMKRVPHIVSIQERACERLWILSWDDENAVSIGRIGGTDLLLRAMARFPDSQHLQLCACEALQNLAVHECNRRDMADTGAILLLVQAMTRHASSSELQQCACTALASLAAGGFAPEVVRAGGLYAICSAAHRFNTDVHVLRAASDAAMALGLLPSGAGPLPAPSSIVIM